MLLPFLSTRPIDSAMQHIRPPTWHSVMAGEKLFQLLNFAIWRCGEGSHDGSIRAARVFCFWLTVAWAVSEDPYIIVNSIFTFFNSRYVDVQ